jgi:O-antigen/teichoic acid export membrane protein
MSNKNKALSAGIGYTIGNILIKGINFLSIPLFSRLLTTEEFGVYNTFLAYDAILCIIISFALYMSLRSAKVEFKEKIDEYTSSITLIYFVISGILLLIIFLFGKYISALLDFSTLILILLVMYSFGSGIITLYNQRIGLEYNYKEYLVIACINSVGNIFISLLFIVTLFRGYKDIGRMLGVTIVVFGIAIYLLKKLYKKSKPIFNKKYWKFGLKYSLPIVPHGISQVLLSQFDRIMIRAIVGNSEAGIYSLAGNIKLILTIITDSIGTTWQTWFYEQIQERKVYKIQKNASYLTCFFAILTICLMTLSPELVIFLGGDNYISGKYVALPMILDAFVLFIYNVIVPAEYFTKKTHYIMIGTLIAAIINVVTNYIFINLYGFIAAAYTTLFSYCCYLILHLIISKALIKFYIIPLKNFFILSNIVIVSFILDLLFIDSLKFRLIFCLIFIVPMIACILKNPKIKQLFK